MKKILPLIVAILVLFTACSGGESTDTTVTETTVTTATTQTTTQVTTTQSTTKTTAQPTTVIVSEVVTSGNVSDTLATQSTSTGTVNLVIDCSEILNHTEDLNQDKAEFVPPDGKILNASVSVNEGDTAFDVLKKGCAENPCSHNCQYCVNGIQMEYTFTPAYQSNYVEGIHQLYEFDCGASSGWVYAVNGSYPNVSSSVYEVHSGDTVLFRYTCTGTDFSLAE